MSTHDRASSNESALPSLSGQGDAVLNADTGFSSDSSQISSRSRELMNDVKAIIANSIPLSDLVDQARNLIAKLTSREEYNQLLHGSPNIELDRVLTAMLDQAHHCGGEKSTRYTASAICACHSDDKEATLKDLQFLGSTWVSHLLFVLKANSSRRTQMNPTPSEYGTPTLDQTAVQTAGGIPLVREATFSAKLLERDGYKCVVTGLRDQADPTYDDEEDATLYPTKACHIIRRAIAVFDKKTALTAFSTLNILSYYASVSEAVIMEIVSNIDDPSNGMTLELISHDGFDKFAWGLKEVDGKPNTYEVQIHKRRHAAFAVKLGKHVTFVDRSALYSEPPRKRQRNTRSSYVGDEAQQVQTGIALPNPLFLRIHNAIAGVLHLSGAGEEIDIIIDRSGHGGTPGGVLLGEDLERLWKQPAIQESVSMLYRMRANEPVVHTDRVMK